MAPWRWSSGRACSNTSRAPSSKVITTPGSRVRAREQIAAAQEVEALRQLRELGVEAFGTLVGAQPEAPRIRRADEVVVDRDGARRCRTHGV